MQTRPSKQQRSSAEREHNRRGGGGSKWLWWTLGIIGLIALAVVLFQLFNEEESAGPEAGVTVSDITDNPEEFYDATVTVSGEVGDLVGPRAFTIGTEDTPTGGELLVVGAQELPGILEGDVNEIATEDVAQVTGPVREFNLAEVEEEIGADLDDALFEEFEGEPVVVANTVDVTAEASSAGDQNASATLADITDNPEEFYGQDLTVDGAVAQVIEPNAFVVVPQRAAEDEEQLNDPAALAEGGVLVVGRPDATPNLSENMSVQTTGTLRQFDAAAFEEDLGVEIDNELYPDWVGQPAILAENVQQTQ